MRKRFKKKRYSCILCKPHKMKGQVRWKVKELAALHGFEQEKLIVR